MEAVIFIAGLALFGLAFVVIYGWYLTWPVVSARVVRVHQGVSDISQIRGPRAYRLVVYEYLFDGKEYTSNRQGFFVKAALGPRKLKGDNLRVSVCKAFPSLSSPRRPFFEGLILLGILLLFSVVAGLFLLRQIS